MANISSPFGTITIKTDTPKTLDVVLKMFKELEEGEYTTELDCFNGNLKEYYNSPTELETGFFGNGRWDYLSNIERFIVWSEKCLSDEEKELLHNSVFEIVYEYTDQEAGCEYLASGAVLYMYDHGKETIVSDGLDTYTYNWKNLIDLDVNEDLDHYIESERWYVVDDLKEEAERFIEETDENLDDILSYYCLTSIDELKDKFSRFKETYDACKKYTEGC